MLTLKKIFWIVLVLLNITFIFAVSYSRLKPALETPSYNEWDNQAANKKISDNSANWRFATVNTSNSPDLELSKASSPDPITLVSETADNNAFQVAGVVEVESIDNALTSSTETQDIKPDETTYGAPKVTRSGTPNDTPADADTTDISELEAAEDSRPNTPDSAATEIADNSISSNIEDALKADISANRKEPTPNIFNADTVEVAAANKADSHAVASTYTDTGKPLNKNSSASKKTSVPNQEANYKVDTYYDGNLVRTEETDSNGNLQVTVKETMDGLGEVSTDDANYIEALEQLSNPKLKPEAPTNKTNATDQAKNKHNNSVDYFNKVDVSEKRTPRPSDNMTLATQIEATIASEDTSTANDSTSNKKGDNYFQTLGNESDERANEMRTIKIVRGDTLWSISQRAYGSGFDYKKIFNANPYLSNPDKIEVGDTLRVPI